MQTFAHYCLLFFQHCDKAQTSVTSSAWLLHTQAWPSERQSKFSCICKCYKYTPRWISVISAVVRLSVESIVSCHGLYSGQATNFCVCCVLVWNNEWEEFQGHVDCPGSFGEFLSANQSSWDTKKPLCELVYLAGVSLSLVLCVTVIKYCLNWTTPGISLYPLCDLKASLCTLCM